MKADELNDEMVEIQNRIKKSVLNTVNSLLREETKTDSWSPQILKALQNTNNEIQELNGELDKVSKNCDDVKLTCDTKAETLAEKKSELKTKLKELKVSESRYDILVQEFEKLQNECMKVKKKTELSTIDRQILDLSRKKLELYDNVTNVMWDYTIPLISASTSGYVRNKSKNYLHAFEFKKHENSTCDLVEKLWKEIELGAGEDWSDIVEMTDLKTIPKLDN